MALPRVGYALDAPTSATPCCTPPIHAALTELTPLGERTGVFGRPALRQRP